MIRRIAWTFIMLMIAVAASPAIALSVPAGIPPAPLSGTAADHAGSQAPGCPCCGQSSSAGPAATSSARTADPVPAPAGGSSSPLINSTDRLAGRFAGIRRIYPKNILEHPDRAAVYAVVVARPGIDTGGIAAELGMNRETLRYHLDKLEAATKVVAMRDRGIVRYYENHGRYTLAERNLLHHLWNPTAKSILTLVAARPGVTQAEIAGCIAITAPTTRWYLQRFREDGIITEQREGKYTRHTVVPGAGKYLTDHPLLPASGLAC